MEEKREIKKTKSIHTLQAIKVSLENLLDTIAKDIATPSLICSADADMIRNYAQELRMAADRLGRNISDERLRECPFCGHEASLYHCDGGDYDNDNYIIECDFCDCSMDFASDKTEEEAIKTWNTRGYHE